MNKTIVSPLFLWVLVAVIAFLMSPGAFGPFLMDDYVHFPKMAWLEEGKEGLLRFIFSNDNGSGRILAYISLLIEGGGWPASPYDFKWNNILFHCLNTVLVYWVVLELFRQTGDKKWNANAPWIALAVSFWWGVHPIQLSPVMLTIQRMTILMGTFVLLGLIVYLKARSAMHSKQLLGWVGLLLGVPFFTLLALLFKEPGFLLPSLMLVIELSIRPVPSNNFKWWKFFVILGGILPFLILFVYYALVSHKMGELYFKRDFTLEERLLTQPRVLVDYIKLIVLPSMSELGPYKDYYEVSRGFLSPVSTLLSIVLLAGLVLLALVQKIKYPANFNIVFFGIFWFIVGHSMESSFVPIELYFEHRNYIPMLGIIIAIVASGFLLPKRLFFTVSGLFFVYLSIISFVTYESAKTWGDEEKLAIFWAEEHPESMRAQYSAMRFYLLHGDADKAYRIVNDFSENDARNLASFPLAGLVIKACHQGKDVKKPELDAIIKKIKSGGFDHGSTAVISMMLNLYKGEGCTLTFEQVRLLISAYMDNPVYQGLSTTNSIINMHFADLYKTVGDLNAVIHFMDEAYKSRPMYEVLLSQAYYFADAGLYDEAMCRIEMARKNQDHRKFAFIYKKMHINRYERIVKDIARSRGAAISSERACEGT